jgi:uncharacterized protein
MSYLLDTGFLYALLNRAEQPHQRVVAASRSVEGQIYLPIPVTTEVAYLILRDLGSKALADFVESLATTEFVLVEPTSADYQRAAEVIRQYADAQIDYVDAILVAIAERLNINQVLTLDQRDFRLFRPKHCSEFIILP